MDVASRDKTETKVGEKKRARKREINADLRHDSDSDWDGLDGNKFLLILIFIVPS